MMGKYINGIGTTYEEKIRSLVRQHNATIIPEPEEFKENLVCVVDNGQFAAAGWTYNEEEMEAFLYPDGRERTWLIVPSVEHLV